MSPFVGKIRFLNKFLSLILTEEDKGLSQQFIFRKSFKKSLVISSMSGQQSPEGSKDFF